MNEATLLSEIKADVLESPTQTVIYLEGVTDSDPFFALLGLPTPVGGIHQGVLVKGLKDDDNRKGSGSEAVRSRVEVASKNQVDRVFGLIDGDGRPVHELAPTFDAPFLGPLFTWQAYCIENLVAKTGWPSVWGDEPDWVAELLRYGPYVALNRIGSEIRSIVRELNLHRYAGPGFGDSLWDATDVAQRLARGKHRLHSYDIEHQFAAELARFGIAVRSSPDEAHALLNGKWLFKHMAPTLAKRDADLCRYEWLAHSRAVGGLPEVRDWWERVTGSPP